MRTLDNRTRVQSPIGRGGQDWTPKILTGTGSANTSNQSNLLLKKNINLVRPSAGRRTGAALISFKAYGRTGLIGRKPGKPYQSWFSSRPIKPLNPLFQPGRSNQDPLRAHTTSRVRDLERLAPKSAFRSVWSQKPLASVNGAQRTPSLTTWLSQDFYRGDSAQNTGSVDRHHAKTNFYKGEEK